jgi:hypothetical protein
MEDRAKHGDDAGATEDQVVARSVTFLARRFSFRWSPGLCKQIGAMAVQAMCTS